MRIEREIVDDEYERVWIDTTPTGWTATGSGLLVPGTARREIRAVDLFAGCGGFSLGMHAAGINVVGALEWEPDAVSTYLFNLGHPFCRMIFTDPESEARWNAHVQKCQRRADRGGLVRLNPVVGDPGFIGFNNPAGHRSGWLQPGHGCRAMLFGDVRQATGRTLLDALGTDQVDAVFGGPPCQGFSRAGKGDPADPRNNLILEFLRLVDELGAETFVMENVPPLLTDKRYRPLWTAFVDRANEMGFNVAADVLGAASYGVPQHRRRVFATGTKGNRAIQFPLPSNWAVTSPVDGEGKDFLRAMTLLDEAEAEADGESGDEDGADVAQGSLFG